MSARVLVNVFCTLPLQSSPVYQATLDLHLTLDNHRVNNKPLWIALGEWIYKPHGRTFYATQFNQGWLNVEYYFRALSADPFYFQAEDLFHYLEEVAGVKSDFIGKLRQHYLPEATS